MLMYYFIFQALLLLWLEDHGLLHLRHGLMGKYIWSKTRVIYTNTTTWESDPACISGGKGENGLGIKSVIEEYYLSTSSSSLIGGSWSTSAPAWVNGKYIWTRTVITYTDGSSTTTDAICVTGAKGETGIGVKSYREQYYLSTSYSTPAGGSWSYNVPSWTDGKFMWTRTVVTYTDNTTWTSDPVCVTGSAGPSGKGVKSFEVLYYLSTSSSTLTGGSWSTTAPKWEDGKYIWTKTKVTYTDNTTYESSPGLLDGRTKERLDYRELCFVLVANGSQILNITIMMRLSILSSIMVITNSVR